MLNKNLHLCFTRPTTPDTSPISKHQDHFNHLSSNVITSPPPTRTTTATATATATATTAAATTTSCSSSSDLIKNFNSLYDNTPASTSNSLSRTSDDFSTSDSETDQSTTPDFATIFASQRFFFSSPGRSNSIVESSSSTCQSQSSLSDSPPESSSSDTLVAGGVPTPTYSPDPYMDFRRSMQEMVEDRKLSDVTTDWDFLHELLLCYLALNPKHAHKYIIGAFADLLISLMASDDSRRREQSDDISSQRQ